MAACYSYKGDWLVMFRKMDKDGSGDLDMEEFTNALRFEAKINKDILPDDDIKDVFAVSFFPEMRVRFCALHVMSSARFGGNFELNLMGR